MRATKWRTQWRGWRGDGSVIRKGSCFGQLNVGLRTTIKAMVVQRNVNGPWARLGTQVREDDYVAGGTTTMWKQFRKELKGY